MARALSKETLLNSNAFVEGCKRIYSGNLEETAERYSLLTEGLTGKIRLFSASGRAEFVGNHTDHNFGLVIASAIDMDVAAAVVPTDDGKITVESLGYEKFSVSIDDSEIDEKEFGTSKAIVKGVVNGFKNHGGKVGGFYARMHSTVCKGAGVSSSASFELVVCKILNALYNNNKFGYKECAIISQYAENVYFGKPSGLMDQLTASHGGVSYMDFADPKNPQTKSLLWSFNDVKIVIVNCGGDHCDLTDEYASIRSDMENVAAYFGKKVLREVEEKDFLDAIPALKEKFSGRAILRAKHFFDENKRVDKAYSALEKGDLNSFLCQIEASGDSSYKLLQNCYPTGDVNQPIPLALSVASTKNILAKRVHGGGFAGTILTFVKKSEAEEFTAYMKSIFGNDCVFAVSVRNVGPAELEF